MRVQQHQRMAVTDMGDFFSGDTDAWTLMTIVLMAGVSVLSRSFFFISSKPWTLRPVRQRPKSR